ncbi:hypothetical protein [Streptomyces rhizosphaericus]|uniref:Uncharacterized protein n=1 Tax=Streptomyces rhizosphaericus TaxID=114699 RepID=A0A6G4AWU9_9ACTN|nr:hypothetical protein [Streptomyces rhizosphaericus]NEW77742.1 hypothetical protein [Streptomyces rhizosphaericus]
MLPNLILRVSASRTGRSARRSMSIMARVALITAMASVAFLAALTTVSSVAFAAAVTFARDVFAQGKDPRTRIGEARVLRLVLAVLVAVSLSLSTAISRYPVESHYGRS